MTLASEKILGGGQSKPVPASVPDGVYSITLISYDPTHTAGFQIEQTAEQWVLEVFAGDELVYTSPAISDLPETAWSLTETVDHGVALEGVTSVRARHVGDGENNILPLCAWFQRTADLPVPEVDALDGSSTPTGDHERDDPQPPQRPNDGSATAPDGTKPGLGREKDPADSGDTP